MGKRISNNTSKYDPKYFTIKKSKDPKKSGTAACKNCSKILKFSGSCSGMKSHLKTQHDIIIGEENKETINLLGKEPEIEEIETSDDEVEDTVAKEPKTNPKNRITHHFTPAPKPNVEEIEDQIAREVALGATFRYLTRSRLIGQGLRKNDLNQPTHHSTISGTYCYLILCSLHHRSIN